MVWARIYGGSSNDEAQSVRQTADGGYIIAGWTNSFGVTPDDAYLVKTNSTGDTLWTRTYGGSLDDDVRCVEQTADGGYVAAGANLYILKTTSTGDTLWTRRFGNGVLYSVKQTPDGGYIVAGNTYSLGHADFYLLRTNSIGDALWTRTYGGVEDDMAHSVQKTSDGGYVVAGLTNSFGAGDYDFYIVKMGTDPKIRIQFPNGGEQWQIFQYHTIGWWGYGFDSIHIELNRDYPVGGWETLAAVTENDGVELVYINAPPSDHCRVRISALEDTLSDISDGDFSIVSSQGYLALARQSLPTSPVLTWNAGTVECPSSFTETFRLKNFGSEAIVVFQPLEPASDEFSRATSCGSYFALAPGQMSTCSLTLAFDPDDDGTYLDTLLIQTDAANGVNGYVRIPLSGTQISTPAAPEVVISPEGIHARLSWESVTHAENGCPVTVTAYLVFYAEELDGPYLFHGYTTDTTYVHTGVLHFAAGMYYHVIATTEELPLLQLLPTEGVMTEAEVVKRM
ncbi:hypothetical protein KJ815_08930, partial [bacterium]|nr:hypothetical protein [bacterium]